MNMVNLDRDKFGRFKKGHIPWHRGKKAYQISQAKLGHHPTQETKQKIRLTKLGSKHTIATKIKMSQAKKGKLPKNYLVFSKAPKSILHLIGGKNPNWNGGSSFEPYGIEFNKALKNYIRWMDNFTCQECGFTEEQLGYKLSIHHIDFNKKNSTSNNLISLCKSCHLQTQFNRQNWTNYFQEKIKNG